MHPTVPFCVAIVAEPLDRNFAHARHDAHAENDIFRIGNFETDFRERRIGRAHNVGNDEHGASAHRAFQHCLQLQVHLRRLRPVIGRTGFLFCRCANESELLDARDVVRIRAMQIRVRNLLLIQLDQHILLKRLLNEKFVLAIGPVTPENIFRLGQQLDLMHPIEHRLVCRFLVANSFRRRNGRCDVSHECRCRSWNRVKTNFPPLRALLQEIFLVDRAIPCSMLNLAPKVFGA